MPYPEPRAGSDGDAALVMGKIHGLRGWSIEFDHGSARLTGLYAEAHWKLGNHATSAVCAGGSWPHSHEPPGKWCDCGLYGLHPNAKAARDLVGEQESDALTMQIYGVVEAWGRVEVHESGFRAEFARPIVLCVRRREVETDWGQLVEGLARAHGAEVVPIESPVDLLEHCRSRSWGLAEGAIAELLRGSDETVSETPSLPAATGAPPARPIAPDQGRSLGELARTVATAIAGVLGALFWLAIWGALAFLVLGVVFGWFGDQSDPGPAAERHLEVLDQAIVGGRRDPVYVALITNHDSHRTALGVAPRLRAGEGTRVSRNASAGPYDHPANVPPEGVAVAFDHLRATPAGKLVAPKLQVAGFPRTAPFPIGRTTARVDQRRCRLSAQIRSAKALDQVPLIGVERRGGRIVGGGRFRATGVSRGLSTYRLAGLSRKACGRDLSWSVYPAMAPSNRGWR